VSARLTHLNERGEAHIVDVGGKEITARRAVARARLEALPATVEAIAGGTLKKGDALAVARIAGIMAAKKTSELIPLCHQLPLSSVDVTTEVDVEGGRVVLTATARTVAQTGVEMEAMTAASVAALTVYDMVKALEKGVEIAGLVLVEKSGGKSGTWRREA